MGKRIKKFHVGDNNIKGYPEPPDQTQMAALEEADTELSKNVHAASIVIWYYPQLPSTKQVFIVIARSASPSGGNLFMQWIMARELPWQRTPHY